MAPATKTKRKSGSKKRTRTSAAATKAQEVAKSEVVTYVEGQPSPWLKGESDSVNGKDG